VVCHRLCKKAEPNRVQLSQNPKQDSKWAIQEGVQRGVPQTLQDYLLPPVWMPLHKPVPHPLYQMDEQSIAHECGWLQWGHNLIINSVNITLVRLQKCEI
jgi:hypothetical protein